MMMMNVIRLRILVEEEEFEEPTCGDEGVCRCQSQLR